MTTVATVVAGVLTSGMSLVVQGAAVGFTAGAVGTLVNGGSAGQAFRNGVIGGIFGAVGAGLSFGVGEVFGHGSGMLGAKVLAHGAVSSIMTRARGGRWNSGFWSGFAGTMLSPMTGMAKGYYAKVASSAVVAGTVSSITGGKFANGAMSGAFRFMFNEWYHDLLQNSGRILGGIGGALQVATGAVLSYSGVGSIIGIPLGIHGLNNIEEAIFEGDGFLRAPYAYVFGNNARKAYAVIDVGTSVASLGRKVGMESVEMWTKNYGSVELYREVYAYQKLSTGTAFFEIMNNANTITSNIGDKK